MGQNVPKKGGCLKGGDLVKRKYSTNCILGVWGEGRDYVYGF
jgi:hypothetical protein